MFWSGYSTRPQLPWSPLAAPHFDEEAFARTPLLWPVSPMDGPHEIAGTIRKGGEWMVAFAQVQIPIFTVLMRRSFGVAGNNYATPRSAASVRRSSR